MRTFFCLGLLLAACSTNRGGTGNNMAMNPIGGEQTGGSSGSLEDAASEPPKGDLRDAGKPADGEDASTPVADYRVMGSASVTSNKQMFSGSACSFEVETFTPDKKRSETNVVIAPGFALAPGLGSSREALTPLAKHLASHGVVTHTVALCTNGQGIDHSRNGQSIAEFGQKQGGSKVIYAGFSGGGLAAMIAASQAQNTVAYFGLDAVDANGLAKGALDRITQTTYALIGEPSSCNNDGNMRAQYENRPTRVVKVDGAQHFTFEGAKCEGIKCALCRGGAETEASAVRAMMSAFVAATAGIDKRALVYWQKGSPQWTSLGVLSDVQ